MKRILILLGILALASCKPETYLGPLDSPLGNWKGVVSKYYFNGENVYEAPGCTYSAISFYKDSLCCIEGVKGAFKWTYSGDSLVVDTTVWKVTELSGRIMNLDYLGIIEKPAAEPDEEVAVTGDGSTDDETPIPTDPVTFAYQGQTIETDGSKYWYMNADGKTVPCFPLNETAEDGSETILCWWDTRSDYYNPF